VALRALTYERLCDSSAHKGQWWLPQAAGTEAWFAARAAQGSLDRQAGPKHR
jgi:nucleolar MIF4G domain-containing protein 1